MVIIPHHGWAQFDTDIWTYRGEYDGVVYGVYSRQYTDPGQLPMFLTDEECDTLRQDKVDYMSMLEPGSEEYIRAQQMETGVFDE